MFTQLAEWLVDLDSLTDGRTLRSEDRSARARLFPPFVRWPGHALAGSFDACPMVLHFARRFAEPLDRRLARWARRIFRGVQLLDRPIALALLG
jgi:hypothetical protein